MLKSIKSKLKHKQQKDQPSISNDTTPGIDIPFDNIILLPNGFFKKLVKCLLICMFADSIIQGIYIMNNLNTSFDKCSSIIASNLITWFCNFMEQFVIMLNVIDSPDSVFHIKNELHAIFACAAIAVGHLSICIIPTFVYYFTSQECYIHALTNSPELWTYVVLQTITFWVLAGICLGGLITIVTAMHVLDNKN